ncbi:GNAT family N-acetyltransferase [Pseudoxanthomonas wuyuanensis]
MSPSIQHQAAAHRFVTQVEGHQAELVYARQQSQLVIEHTGVPAAIAGRGIAGELVKAALEFARSSALKVVPACSYAATYIQRHPQYRDLLAAGY